jgi:hydroxymethylbilane synthase
VIDFSISIDGLVATIDGRELIKHHLEGPADQAESLGTKLAEILLRKGAKEILDEVYQKTAPMVGSP